MPLFQYNILNRVTEVTDDEPTNTPRRPIPVIDNPPPGILSAEEDRNKTKEWLDKAPAEVKRDQKEFQTFSQRIVAKALTHTPHDSLFYSSIKNDFTRAQLLRCIYYLSSKIHDKDNKSSNGYEFALKRVREGARGESSSRRRNDAPQSSESAPRQHHSGQSRNTHNVHFSTDDNQLEQDTTHRSNRDTPTRSSTRILEGPSRTNNSRSAAASAAADAAINRRAALSTPPDSTTEDVTILALRLSEVEAEIACHNVERVELYELKQEVEARKCKICYAADIDCIFVDCYHMATCLECAQGCEKCPVCRKEGVSVAKVYF